MYFSLIVEYNGGIDGEFDDLLEDAAGEEICGSGCFLMKPYPRDIEFAFSNRKKRDAAATAVKKVIAKQKEAYRRKAIVTCC